MRAALPLLLLTACGADPTGIWLIQTPVDGIGTVCDTTQGENFIYGQWPADEEEAQSDWTYTEEQTYGDDLGFGQIETMGADEAVLVLGDTVIPGAWDKAKDQWLFAWTDEESAEDGETHVAGYAYQETQQSSAYLEVRFTLLDADHAEGKITNSSVGRTTWTETDAWDATTVGVSYTQLPSSTYLEATDGSGTTVENSYAATDCEDAECNLWYQTTCSIDEEFSATRTDYEGEDVYGYLQYATQPGD